MPKKRVVGGKNEEEREGRWEGGRDSTSSHNMFGRTAASRRTSSLNSKIKQKTAELRPVLDLPPSGCSEPPAQREVWRPPSLENLQQEVQRRPQQGHAPSSEWFGRFIYLHDAGSFVSFHFNHQSVGGGGGPRPYQVLPQCQRNWMIVHIGLHNGHSGKAYLVLRDHENQILGLYHKKYRPTADTKTVDEQPHPFHSKQPKTGNNPDVHSR